MVSIWNKTLGWNGLICRFCSDLSLFQPVFILSKQHWKHQNNLPNLFKENNKNTKRRHCRRSDIVIVNFEQISYIILLLLLIIWASKYRLGYDKPWTGPGYSSVTSLVKFNDEFSCLAEAVLELIGSLHGTTDKIAGVVPRLSGQ